MAPNDRRSISDIEVFAPSVQVRFHTDRGLYEVEAKKLGIGGSEETLVACQTWKDISQPAGSFMVHLADFARYDKMIFPNDLCTIKMSTHTPPNSITGASTEARDRITHATMIGLVDSVRRKRLIDPNTGKPNVFCEIKGRDMGKLFVKHQVRYIPWLQDSMEGQTMLQPVIAMFKYLLSGFATGGQLDFLMAQNIKKFFSEAVDLRFPLNGRTVDLKNAISYRAMSQMGVIPYNLPLSSQEGSLWQILQNYANLPFNELWIDTINNPELVISNLESSKLSSPLSGSSLAASRASASTYIDAQSGADQKQSLDTFGAGGSKISLAERWNGSPDNCNAYTMVFFRRTPFDKDDWAALPTFNISNSDILEHDLGVSDSETYNMFWVYPLLAVPGELPLKGLGVLPLLFSEKRQWDTAPDPAKGNAFPRAIIIQGNTPESNRQRAIARRNAVEKFGFNPLEVKTRVWRWANGANIGSAVQTANLLTLALANWHKHNSILKSGSMTIKGIPDLHVGNKLYNSDENEEYYVEAVSNNYVQYQAITTTVMLTRGQVPGSIDWGNAYRNFCMGMPLKPGSQQEGL